MFVVTYFTKENVREIGELSLLQQHILDGLAGNSPEEIQGAVRRIRYGLEGEIQVHAVQKAADSLIDRHPVLRTIFRQVKNKTVRVVLKTRPIEVKVFDMRAVESQQIDENLSFSVEEGPLLQIRLYQITDTESAVEWFYHSAVLDELSLEMLWQEWLEIYHAAVTGEPAAHRERSDYRVYTNWLSEQSWRQAKSLWQEQFASFEAAAPLPNPVSLEVKEYTGWDSRLFTLPHDLSQRIDSLANEAGVDPEAIFLTAWAYLLKMYSGEASVTLGWTGNGRPSELSGSREIIGRLQNTLPLHVEFQGDQPAREVLKLIRDKLAAVKAYQYLPLPEIAAYLDVPAGTPLFTSGLEVRNTSSSESSWNSTIRVRSVEEVNRYPYPLHICWSKDASWQVRFQFDMSNLHTKSVERVWAHYSTLLNSLVHESHLPLQALTVMPADEYQRLLIDYNESPFPAPALERLAHLNIEDQVLRLPHKTAAIFGDERITYAELNDRANRLAHGLRRHGFGRNDLAGILMDRSIAMLVAILGTLKAGGAYVPLDVAYPQQRLSSIISDSGIKAVLTANEFKDFTKSVTAQIDKTPLLIAVHASEDASEAEGFISVSGYSSENPEFINEPQDLANVFYTSGSTGTPKGVMVEHLGMLNHLFAKIQVSNLIENSIVAQNASHCFDISVWQFLAPLIMGATVTIYSNEIAKDPLLLLGALQKDESDILELVPSMIEMILDTATIVEPEQRILPKLKVMLSTGEGLSTHVWQKWAAQYPGTTVVNTYGATETSDDVAHLVLRSDSESIRTPYVHLGSPIPNMKLYVLDEGLRPVPQGCRGEIYITGIGVGRGYLGDPERTARAFIANPFNDGTGVKMYRMGDIGKFTEDGSLQFLGRADHQVKVRGHRIELGEIDSVLREDTAVQQCVVIVRADSRGQNRILAYVVGDEVQVSALTEKLDSKLPDYMMPDHIIVLDELPLNSNGKVDRKKLSDPSEDRVRLQVVEPRTETEKELCQIWEEVLGLQPVSVVDNFFDLGGHSLTITQVRSRIKHTLGLTLTLKEMFEHQTIEQLAQLVDQVEHRKTDDRIALLPQADHYATSHAQRRLFFIQQMEPANTAYNMPVAVEYKGMFDVAIYEQIVKAIVQRQEALRTTFQLVDGVPMQVVHPDVDIPISYEDIREFEESGKDRHFDSVMKAELEQSFDLIQGPLFRTRIIRLADEHYQLWFNMHHIVSDAWSWELFVKEVIALYKAFDSHADYPLPPLEIHYKEYTSWQNARMENGDFAAHEAFWLEQLSGELPVLELPTDFPRPAIQQFDGRTISMEIDPGTFKRIQSILRETETTIFMFIAAACSTFLSRVTGQTDLILGTPEAGRNRLELENLIGFFVNTLPLRFRIQKDWEFAELLAYCKQLAMDVYGHHEYPFDLLVDRLNPVRDLSRSPVFSVIFQIMRMQDFRKTSESLQWEQKTLDIQTTKFDLNFTFEETEQGLILHLNYSTHLFESGTIRRWLDYFQVLLRHMAEQPNLKIGQLPMIEAAEKQRLVSGIRSAETKDRPLEFVHRKFESMAEKYPAQIAVVYEDTSLTYWELNRRANRLARELKSRNVGPEQFVGLYAERSVDLIVGLLGILKAGGAYVPLDPAFPKDRLRFMAEDSELSLIVTQEALKSTLEGIPVSLLTLDGDVETFKHHDSSNLEGLQTLDDAVYVIYTSGSTGRPKGVVVEHRNLSHYVDSIAQVLELGEGASFATLTTIAADLGNTAVFPALCSGGTLHVISKERASDAELLADYFRNHSIECLKVVPSHLKALLSAQQGRILPKKRLILGGEALKWELAESVAALAPHCTVINHYGPTETTIGMATYRVNPFVKHPHSQTVPLGRPIENMQAYVLDEHLQPVPTGMVGELYIGGAGVSRGYLNNPTLTAEKFINHPFAEDTNQKLYRTGDRVRLLHDHQLEFMGRIDYQVKIRGYRIELSEIENALLQLQAVEDAAIIVAGQENEPSLQAFVKLSQGKDDSLNDIRAALALDLPDYMIPSSFVVLEAMPLNDNGKLDRKQLVSLGNKEDKLLSKFAMPRDRIELEMSKIWEEVLDKKQISITDNFFALGGHSLKALSLISLIRKRLGARIQLTEFLKSPTVEQLSNAIRGSNSIQSECLVNLQKGSTSGTPLFFIHPQGGGVMAYTQFVKEMAIDDPIYGIQSVGYESDVEPLKTVEQMAQHYISEIRKVAPAGPYRLAGWSFGGTVAFEMTWQLEQMGERVEFLGLLDTRAIESETQTAELTSEEDIWTYLAVTYEIGQESLQGLTSDQKGEFILQRAKEKGDMPEAATAETTRNYVKIMVYNGQALQNYQYPGPIHTPIHLFHVSEQSVYGHESVDPHKWESWTARSVLAYPVAGDHLSMMEYPYAKELSAKLNQALSEVAMSPLH